MNGDSRMTENWVRIALTAAVMAWGATACRKDEAPAAEPAATARPAEGDPVEDSTVSLIAEADAVVPGAPWSLGLEFRMPAGWHTYWHNPGETGMAPAVRWTLPAGVRFERLRFPTPEWFEEDGIVSFGYEDRVWLLAEFSTDEALAGPVEIEARVDWMICKDVCIPVQSAASLALPVATASSPDPARQGDFARWRARLPQEPRDWAFDVARAGRELTLRVRPGDARVASQTSWDHVRLHPLLVGATLPSTPVRWHLEDDRWVARIPAGPSAPAVGERFEAVLAMADESGITGWRLSATVGE